jgi:hypothetical protein
MEEDVSEMTSYLVGGWSLILGTDFLFLRLSSLLCCCQWSQSYEENEANSAVPLKMRGILSSLSTYTLPAVLKHKQILTLSF